MSKVGMSESGSGLWSSFTTAIKRKGKKQSPNPTAFSNYAFQISPTSLIRGKSKALVRIVSISRDGDFIPVIMSSVGKEISNERQPTKKKKQLGFDAAEMKVKSQHVNISVKSREPEVSTQELAAKQLSENRRSWVRVAKAFRFPKVPGFHRNGPRVSKNPIRSRHANDTRTRPEIEQQKAQEIRQEKKVADSIPGPIQQPSKSSHASAAVDFKSSKVWKFVNFHRKVNCQANKSPEIKSSTLLQLSRANMHSTTPNSELKKLSMSAERKGTMTGDATSSEGEGYSMAINLSVLIIIMTCLAVFSNRLLAVLCTSIWWYLLPRLLKRRECQKQGEVLPVGDEILNARNKRKVIENPSYVSGAIRWCEYGKREGSEGFAEALLRWSSHLYFYGIIPCLTLLWPYHR